MLSHPRAGHLLAACGLLLGLILAGGAAWVIVEWRAAVVAEAVRDLTNLALVLAEEVDRRFEAVNVVETGLIEQLRTIGIASPEQFISRLATPEIRELLRQRLAALPGLYAMSLTDSHGRIVNRFPEPLSPSIVVADRDYFQALAADSGPTTFISQPAVSRSDGTWTIFVGHKITARDGRFLGIVTTSLQVAEFEQFFSRITLGPQGSVALFQRDGMLLVRYPHLDMGIASRLANRDRFRPILAAANHGSVQLLSIIDGAERLIVPRSLPHFPLLVAVSGTTQTLLAGWRVQARSLVAATVMIELILVGIVLLGVRQLHSQEHVVAANAAAMKAETARAWAEAELAVARQREAIEHASHLQSQRFDVALGNMVQGLLMVDRAGQLLIVNQRFTELFGLPVDIARSVVSYIELVDLIVCRGDVTSDDMAAVRAWRRGAIANQSKATFTWELADGRILVVTHRTIPDGWLTTYEDVTERRRADARMAHMARHDALTDLPNRVLFREKLEEAIAQARRGRTLALLCLDLDQFKAVNDTLGHPVGDALLQAVAGRLAERIRETDIVARLGGDEFAVVRTQVDKPAEAADFAERLIAMLDQPFEVHGHQVVIGTSVGIAFAPQDGQDADQLLKNADLALYRAKSDGRGVYRLFQTEMDAEMQARRLLELDLRQALHGNQFELYYQPLIDLRIHAVAGYEALLRWHHPERGMVPPGQFIPLAEEIGAIVPIGEWVLRQACAAAATWPGQQRVSINLSVVQFKSRNLVASVAAALREARLDPGRLELEITETVMLQDTDTTLATLHELRNLGVSIAMDDFGTGYSSLSYLRRFPFDRVKIDQSFVREIGKQRDCGAIIRAVLALSHEFGMATIAEGVETREQLCALALAGCSDIQGYLFSSALSDFSA